VKFYSSKSSNEFIGRESELEKITEVLNQTEASLLIVYGRRRIGKTALIENGFRKKNLLKFEGLEKGTSARQREHFKEQLASYCQDPDMLKLTFKSWKDCFIVLANRIENKNCVLYFEEIQWMANYRTELISDLKYVWDNYFSKNKNLVLILCGSSPSFIIDSIISSQALYNRSQFIIHLQPFSFNEVCRYFKNQRANFEMMDLLLSVGGVPEYLRYFKNKNSVFTNLVKNSFTKDGFFTKEEDRIFSSSFKNKSFYKKIVDYLALHKEASREELGTFLKLKTGGAFSKILQNLEQTGLIEYIFPIGSAQNSKKLKYCISDNYLQFYFKFVKPKIRDIEAGRYTNSPQSALVLDNFRKWQGFAFERWCRRYHFVIAKALGFSAVDYEAGPLFIPGAQIDLIFKRKDRVFTLCEIKYNTEPCSASVIQDFSKKQDIFKSSKIYQASHTIQRVLIAAGGASPSVKKQAFFDQILTLEDMVEHDVSS
jgi:AAA+ ATPase superfamily predicted ATPase